MKNNMGINPFEWFQSEKKEPPSWEDTAPSEYEPPVDNRWAPPERRAELEAESNPRPEAVSYTHLTLPTILLV